MFNAAEKFHECLTDAIDEAIELFANEAVDPGELNDYRLPKMIGGRDAACGVAKIPVAMPSDLSVYLYALMALNVIAAGRLNSDREGAPRLLYAGRWRPRNT